MKVKVSLTVDVDADAWSSEFDVKIGDVRADVKTYVFEMVSQQLIARGLATDVTEGKLCRFTKAR